MPDFRIYMVDLLPGPAHRILRFSEVTKQRCAEILTSLFARVCETTAYTPAAGFFANGTPAENELAVYFVQNRERGLISRLGIGSVPSDAEGATALTAGNTVVSEIHVEPVNAAGANPELLARLAFHELMHNKLDTHPDHRTVSDLHRRGGHGLADLHIAHSTPLTEENIALMRAALGRPVPQYWDGGLVSRP